MTALKIIGWIIVAIIGLIFLIVIIFNLLMSVKITLRLDAGEDGKILRVKWGLFKFKVYPEMFTPEKKEKFKAFANKLKTKFGPLIKKKKSKKSKKKEDKKEKITKFDFKSALNKSKEIYQKLGSFSGILELLDYIASKTSKMAIKVLRSFTFKEIYVDLTVAGDDAANTAIKYGKTCAVAFPALGTMCTNLKVRKYDLDINPDFLAQKNSGNLHTVISFRPIRLIFILTIYFLKVLNKILVKILFSKSEDSEDTKMNKKSKIEIGGA